MKTSGLPDIRPLVKLCGLYCILYVANGISAKYFTHNLGLPELTYTYYNTTGSVIVALAVVLVWRWYRMPGSDRRRFGLFSTPVETPYIVLSGICAAVIIPGTTLMYTRTGLSVMVAMAIMRGCVIVISRLVDWIQIRQGLMRKRVYAEESWAVILALLAVAVMMLYGPLKARLFPTVAAVATPKNGVALTTSGLDTFHYIVLAAYVIAYAIRLYCMNYYKNTRHGREQDNKGYFSYEQFAAWATLIVTVPLLLWATSVFHWTDPRLLDLQQAAHHANLLANASGVFYGCIAFTSVFIFMYRGRTATFAGVANRTSSLLAGVIATLGAHWLLGLPWPKSEEWVGVGLLLVAIMFLYAAEKKRSAEVPRRNN
ncbi:MAG: hypothetical protein C3F02_00640 [Parcubacteria group bacterium]|nr:MAG: hypothetical protein C3F02_00640 [Parcubacteria group bacterium]